MIPDAVIYLWNKNKLRLEKIFHTVIDWYSYLWIDPTWDCDWLVFMDQTHMEKHLNRPRCAGNRSFQSITLGSNQGSNS